MEILRLVAFRPTRLFLIPHHPRSCHSTHLAKFPEMKSISKPRLPIEIYTICQKMSLEEYRKKRCMATTLDNQRGGLFMGLIPRRHGRGRRCALRVLTDLAMTNPPLIGQPLMSVMRRRLGKKALVKVIPEAGEFAVLATQCVVQSGGDVQSAQRGEGVDSSDFPEGLSEVMQSRTQPPKSSPMAETRSAESTLARGITGRGILMEVF
jgi:hypothetical protein